MSAKTWNDLKAVADKFANSYDTQGLAIALEGYAAAWCNEVERLRKEVEELRNEVRILNEMWAQEKYEDGKT